MISPSLNELKLVAKSKGIKDCKNKSKNKSIKIISKSRPKLNFSKQKLENIRKKLNEARDGFSKSKIKEIRRNLYEIEIESKSFYTKNKRD